MEQRYFTYTEAKKAKALPEIVKEYLSQRFRGDIGEWVGWALHYEWNHDEMIRVVIDNTDKPD